MKNLMTEMARQGDVLIRRIDAIPAAVRPVERDGGRVILAYGEVTGHAHAFRASSVTMYMDTGSGSGGRYLRVAEGEPAPLQHEEHDTVRVPAGDYEVLRQCEYTPEAIRNVAD